MKIKLTDRTVKQANPPASELWDLVLPGFGLRIGARKRTFFAMARIDGKQVRHRIGTTESHTLGEAREAAREWLRNPTSKAARDAVQLAQERAARRERATTFAAVAQRYLDKPRTRELKSRHEIERVLKADIPVDWKYRPISSISRVEVRELFEAKARTSPVAANRLLSKIKTIFFYALEQDLVDANPAQRITPIEEVARDRVLTDHESGASG